jgi:hypothetical protein
VDFLIYFYSFVYLIIIRFAFVHVCKFVALSLLSAFQVFGL